MKRLSPEGSPGFRRFFRGVLLFIILTSPGGVLLGCVGCAREKVPGEAPREAPGEASRQGGENQTIKMVLMIETDTTTLMREKIIPMIRARFPGIHFISKVRNDAQIENSIKNSFVTGESIDIVAFWPHQMRTFVDLGMALDLTPYLEADPAWKDLWIPGVLQDGCFDGRYYALPYRSSYPLLLVNRELAAAAGVVIKEQWTWEEFIALCRKIKDLTGVYPLGINRIWSCWLVRNGLLQTWDTDEELEAFTRGAISFTDPRVTRVFENVKVLYDNEYLYPGKAALTAAHDQVLAAFARGKVAIMANVNGNVSTDLKNVVAGAFETAIVSWPNMGSPAQDRLLGSNDGYFIPANTKYPDEAVEVLKYLTSPEILKLHAEEGRILTFRNIISPNPDYPFYSRDIRKVHTAEIVNFSSELNDYIIYNIPANYILYGDQAIADLEILRATVKP
jgi:ABC-type glycerol-3-phosphate transport system substrate-binding protein